MDKLQNAREALQAIEEELLSSPLTAEKKTEAELRELAEAIVDGKVFTSNEVDQSNSETMAMIFLPLGFVDAEEQAELNKHKIVLVYEFRDKALMHFFGRLPMFATAQFLLEEQVEELNTYVQEYVGKSRPEILELLKLQNELHQLADIDEDKLSAALDDEIEYEEMKD